MFEKKAEMQKNPNELVFTKTKGLGSMNYAVVSSVVNIDETGFSVKRTNKVFFFKKKPQVSTIDYDSIANVTVKTNFAKGDLISGIILGVFAIIIALTGAFGEESPGILVGPIIIAVMVFCAYGKNIVITRKDATKVIIMSEGFGQGDEIKAFCTKLAEKGVTVVYEGKK
jgi:hypothetical protein